MLIDHYKWDNQSWNNSSDTAHLPLAFSLVSSSSSGGVMGSRHRTKSVTKPGFVSDWERSGSCETAAGACQPFFRGSFSTILASGRDLLYHGGQRV